MNGHMKVNEVDILPSAAIESVEALRVLVDSQRHRMVTLLIAEPLTARDLAERLGIGRTRMYYHLDLLEKHGLIRVVETRVVSGIQERTYRAVARTFRVDRTLLGASSSEPQIADAQAAILDAAAADLRARSIAGETKDDDVLVFRSFVRLSDARRRELRQRLSAVLEEYRDGESRGDETEIALALFPMAKP